MLTMEKVEAGCVVDGHTEEYTCSVCGTVTTESTTIPNRGGHTYTITVEAVEPTCVKKGHTAEIRCSVCGELDDPSVEIPTKGHTYTAESTVTTPPTCTAKGYTTYTCTECGVSAKKDFVDRLPHADEDGDGYCDTCGGKMTADGEVTESESQQARNFIDRLLAFLRRLVNWFKGVFVE